MPLVEDVARAALAAIDTDAGLMRSIKWTIERYDELASRVRLKHLRRVAELTLPAPVTTGLATVTAGDTLVVGNVDALVAWSNLDLVGRWFRAAQNYYEIAALEPLGLRLKSPWTEAAVGALSYKIIARFVPLASDLRWPGAIVFPRRRRMLDWRTPMEIDIMAPGRESATAGPLYAVDRGIDVATGNRLIECYPYPNQAEQLLYTYTARPPALYADSPLPHEVSVALLKVGVIIDLYRYEMARALRAGQAELAAVWRNEARAQRTEWENAIKDLVHLDSGADDATAIMSLFEGEGRGLSVYDAHSDVLARWRGF